MSTRRARYAFRAKQCFVKSEARPEKRKASANPILIAKTGATGKIAEVVKTVGREARAVAAPPAAAIATGVLLDPADAKARLQSRFDRRSDDHLNAGILFFALQIRNSFSRFADLSIGVIETHDLY